MSAVATVTDMTGGSGSVEGVGNEIWEAGIEGLKLRFYTSVSVKMANSFGWNQTNPSKETDHV